MPHKKPRRKPAVLSNDPAAARLAEGFPHLVVRLMPAVYTRTAIEWTLDPLDQGFRDGNRLLRILDPEPEAGAALTPARRQIVLDVAQTTSTRVAKDLCAVFGKRDCVYLSPRAAPKPSSEPPEGGVSLYDVQHQRAPAVDEH